METIVALVFVLLLVGATYKWRWHPIVIGLLGGVAFSALFAVVDWLKPTPTRTSPLVDFLLYIVIYGVVIVIVCMLVARALGQWWVEKEESEEEESPAEEEGFGRFS